MTKLEKVLLTIGGVAVAGTMFSLWQSKRDLEDENEDLVDENISLRSRLPREEKKVEPKVEKTIQENILNTSEEISKDVADENFQEILTEENLEPSLEEIAL